MAQTKKGYEMATQARRRSIQRIVTGVAIVLLLAALGVWATTQANTTQTNESSEDYSALNIGLGTNESERTLAWLSSRDTDQYVQYALVSDDFEGGFPALGVNEVDSSRTPASDSDSSANHATLTGLEAASTYVYRVGDDDHWSDAHTFSTSAADSTYEFIFVGDPQIGASGSIEDDAAGWADTLNVSTAAHSDAEFIYSAGDQVQHASSFEEYDGLLRPDTFRSIPFVPTIGNHDVDSSAFHEHFNVPNLDVHHGAESSGKSGGNWWFKYGDTLFVSINSNSSDMDSHVEFMSEVMDEHGANTNWAVLGFHHSVASVARHADSDVVVDLRESLMPVISDIGFDLVLAGHDHSYTRSYLMDGRSPVPDTAGDVLEPGEGEVLYITGNSSSGSKYHKMENEDASFQDYAAVTNQEDVPTYSSIEVDADSVTITSYRTTDGSVVDEVTISSRE